MSLYHGLTSVAAAMVVMVVATATVGCGSTRVTDPLARFEPILPAEVPAALECAKDGTRVLRVDTGSDGEVQISESPPTRLPVSDIASLRLPFDPSIGLPLEPETVALRQGRWTAVSTDNGWIVGVDAGEFVGGLWFFDRINRSPVLLRRENTIFVGGIGRQYLAITQRGASESGATLRIERDGTSWRLVDVGSFAGTPIRAFGAAPTAVLVVSTEGLFRFDGSGMKLLTSDARVVALATAMTGAETGQVTYVGMPMLVLVAPSAGQAAWYRRKGCALRIETGPVEVSGGLALIRQCVC